MQQKPEVRRLWVRCLTRELCFWLLSIGIMMRCFFYAIQSRHVHLAGRGVARWSFLINAVMHSA
jgi:hypothetical protein